MGGFLGICRPLIVKFSVADATQSFIEGSAKRAHPATVASIKSLYEFDGGERT